jgi:hypothetical protein
MWKPRIDIRIAAPELRFGALNIDVLNDAASRVLRGDWTGAGSAADPYNGSLSSDEMKRIHTESVWSNLRYKGEPLPYTVERLFFSAPGFSHWDYAAMTCARAVSDDLFVTPAAHPLAGDALRPALAQAYRGRRWDNLDSWGTPAASLKSRPLVRISSLADYTVQFAKSDYDTQAVTNLVVDMRVNGRSLREFACQAEGSPEPPFGTRHLANTLGVSVLFLDGATPIMPLRSNDVAIHPNQWGTTVSFALEFPDASVAEPRALHDLIAPGLDKELHDELALKNADAISLVPLALCREWLRAGKPQLFFAARTPLTVEEIQARYARAEHGREVANVYGRFKVQKAVWNQDARDKHLFSPELLAALALVELHTTSAQRDKRPVTGDL